MKPSKKYKVSEVRSTLGTIVTNLFTDTFAQKYERYMGKYGDSPEAYISALVDNSDDVTLAVGNLYFTYKHYPYNLDAYIDSTPDEIIGGIYLRYCILTKYLMSIDQAEILTLPENPDDFYLELLINYWLMACPEALS